MEIFKELNHWREFRKTLQNKTIGFVATMGNLHDGHAALFKRSVQENQYTVVSIFVNPTQFNQQEDFIHYPRTLEKDFEILKNCGVNYCLLPTETEVYADKYRFQLTENNESLLMEGTHRPGHFNGVLTVVMKLFNLVQPSRAYFGEKDYQQLSLITDMVNAFFLNIEIIPCPTIREQSSLACSSRNNRLTPEQKARADMFAKIFHEGSSKDQIKQSLLQEGFEVEYIEEYKNRRFAAIKIGEIRLIDNYSL
ncbi:pantoate--beta-alanine ligase (plasmid) [Legionella adelaidensis]|uniref:Pantothenate synthetase n=1 Tax=Legionella adelaidensis TaxID=45056 RepID=A0A0W0R611_9GAMM|nr:pantoate--beta-alanine ligase [Legionella adelaidensis]KTC66473.1 pantoate-beta-alanine ligase [Legionella adelaidensis]VEH86239.1 pantoate--beta-alanine ligase [Legionella adelaidensis]